VNSRENRIWAWGVGGFVLVLLGVAAAGQENDEGTSSQVGVAVGRIAASVAIAYALRWLWLRLIRRDREAAVTSPWIAVIAAIVAALALAGSAGSDP
jgi:NhaP-type Na+/H+ or K+/H+ antiporter